MGVIVDKKLTKITTDDGRVFIRRKTKVLCPNGKYRYPVDYYESTSSIVRVSKAELDRIRIPVYKQLI